MILPLTSLVLIATVNAAPSASSPSHQYAFADSDSVLTVATMTKMTTFWSHLMHEPDSVKDAVQRHKTVGFMVGAHGRIQPVPQYDMEALATHQPLVAAELKRTGLTAQTWARYYDMLWNAVTAQLNDDAAPRGSALQDNLDFLDAHAAALKALRATGLDLPTQNQS